MKPIILFDFDGTLADSVSLGIDLLNTYAGKFGYRTIDCEKSKGLSALQLMGVAGIRFWKLPYLMCFFRKKIAEQAAQIQLISGIGELLAELRKSDFELGILTSNSAATVTAFLHKYGLESYFSYVKTDVSLFGKKRAIRSARRKTRKSIVYVGDELRDVEACRKTGTPVVSVSWGFNTADVLERSNPGCVAETADAAFTLIRKLAAGI
ncbi:MAG: HAD hydrolase-like protein [Treponema sp.]|nr:HAD hydrolase-like protein [Treponema sp.]